MVGLVSMENAEILRNQLLIVQNVTGAPGEHAAPGVENHGLIRNIERQLEVLFDQHDGLAFLLETPDGAADLSDDQCLACLARACTSRVRDVRNTDKRAIPRHT